MRIREDYKRFGDFWLPTNQDRKIPGILSISDGGNIELELMGLFNESITAINHEEDLSRIFGQIEKDGPVTLENCFYKKWNLALGGKSKSLVYANRMFIGASFEEGGETKFNTFRFSIEGIDEWVGISGIKVDNQSEKFAATITYQLPGDISINLSNGMQLLIAFSYEDPSNYSSKEVKITQKTYFKLTSSEKRGLEDFMSAAHKITTLLCFAIDQTVCLEDVSATSNDLRKETGDGHSYIAPIRIYYPSYPFSEEEPKIDFHTMLFRFRKIQKDAEKIFSKWFDAYERIEPAFNLYFSTKTGAQKYPDGKFLALAQGLEAYHRLTSNEKVMDDEKFRLLVTQIVSKCPEENKEWLKERLTYSNEISFRNRLKRLIKPFREYIGNESECKKIIGRIVDTRNYLTHYDESLKSKAVSGIDLWLLGLKLEALFQMIFLQVLGFTKKDIESIIENCSQLKKKLDSKKEIKNRMKK